MRHCTLQCDFISVRKVRWQSGSAISVWKQIWRNFRANVRSANERSKLPRQRSSPAYERSSTRTERSQTNVRPTNVRRAAALGIDPARLRANVRPPRTNVPKNRSIQVTATHTGLCHLHCTFPTALRLAFQFAFIFLSFVPNVRFQLAFRFQVQRLNRSAMQVFETSCCKFAVSTVCGRTFVARGRTFARRPNVRSRGANVRRPKVWPPNVFAGLW